MRTDKRKQPELCELRNLPRGHHGLLTQRSGHKLAPTQPRLSTTLVMTGSFAPGPQGWVGLWENGRRSVSSRHGAWFALCCLAPPAVQAGKNGNHEARVQIHRSFEEHGTLAFIARSHEFQANIDRCR